MAEEKAAWLYDQGYKFIAVPNIRRTTQFSLGNEATCINEALRVIYPSHNLPYAPISTAPAGINNYGPGFPNFAI